MQSNIFKIDYEIKTIKRARVSFDFSNYNFLIKESENQILNKIRNLSFNSGVLVELGSNSSIGKLFSKSDNYSFVSIDNSLDFLKENSLSNNNIVFAENNLPFKQESISGMISCLYLDSMVDSENLFTNIYKILKNDGFLIFSIFGTKTMENIKECFIKIEEKKYNGISLRFNPLFDFNLIGNNLKQIGFKNVVVETEIIKVKYNSLFKLMYDLRGMGITNNLINRSKFFTPKSLFEEVNEFLINNNKNKEFLVPFEILTLTAWKENL